MFSPLPSVLKEIIIKPYELQLKRSPNDVYSWERLNDKEHMFFKEYN